MQDKFTGKKYLNFMLMIMLMILWPSNRTFIAVIFFGSIVCIQRVKTSNFTFEMLLD